MTTNTMLDSAIQNDAQTAADALRATYASHADDFAAYFNLPDEEANTLVRDLVRWMSRHAAGVAQL